MKTYLESMIRTKDVWRWLFALADGRQWRKWMTIRYCTILIRMAAGLAQPGVLGILVASATLGRTDQLSRPFLFLAGTIVLYQVLTAVTNDAHEWLWGLGTEALSLGIFKRFVGKSPGQHAEHKDLNRESIEHAENSAQDLINNKARELFETASMVVLGWLFLLKIWPVTGVALTGAIAIHFVCTLYLNGRAEAVCTSIDDEFREWNRYRAARLENVVRVITSGKRLQEEVWIRTRFREIAARDRAYWHWHLIRENIRDSLVSCWALAIFGYALYRVSTGDHHRDVLLVPVWIWSMAVRDNLQKLGWIERHTLKHIPRVQAMIGILETPPAIIDEVVSVELPRGESTALIFDGVSHSYPRGSRVLSDVSFDVSAGEVVAIVGPTGGGKSTLLQLLMRFMDPMQGRILVDGIDLRNIKLDSWMRKVGYIPQSGQILGGTVRYNLAYGLSEDELCERDLEPIFTATLAKLHIDFGARPAEENPLDIPVGRGGVKLSGGQKQRLMIGAAVIKRPDFLIIDEATSNLDSTTEKAVLTGLDELILGKGVVVIAHRLSTIRRADKIVVLSHGHVEAIASSFAEGYRISPTFRQMADDQHLAIE